MPAKLFPVLRKGFVAAVFATALTIGAGGADPGGLAATSPAPLRVSPNGSDSAPCTASSPCASFARAYRVATPGRIIEVSAGTYPPQRISFDARKTGSARVVFQPRNGAAVRIHGTGVPWDSGLEVSAHHVVVRNMVVDDQWAVEHGADDVSMDNVDAKRFYIGSASNVAVHGGSFGPFYDESGTGGSHVWPESETSPDPTNIVIDGIKMHDYTIPSGSGFHLDCLTIGGGSNVTLARSRFWNCNGFDAWTKPYPKHYGTNHLTFVNNVFGANLGGTPQVVSFACADSGSTLKDILFQYNSVAGDATFGTVPFPCTLEGTGVTFRANVMPEINTSNCGERGFVSVYNVVRAHPCGPLDRAFPSDDLWRRMPATIGCSPAVNRGDPAVYPRRDIRGAVRPRDGRAEAGPYENVVSKSCKWRGSSSKR